MKRLQTDNNVLKKELGIEKEKLHTLEAAFDNMKGQGMLYHYCVSTVLSRVQWLKGRASDSGLRGQVFFTLHCSSSLSCINEYLAIDSGGYAYEQPSHIHCGVWLDASQRS